MNLNAFWKQPAKGFDEETRGRTEEEICLREAQIGFIFPETYRELMKLQNGGFIRKSAFYINGNCKELLYNGATIDKITTKSIGYQTMYDVLSEWMTDGELNSLSPTKYNYLKRLPIISHMDGHAWMCFDYGWFEKDEKSEPEICFFNDQFNEYLRITTFDEFVKGLVYYGYESCEYCFGIYSEDSLGTLSNKIGAALNIQFEEKADNKFGWFNFDKWFSADLAIEENHRFQFSLSPNKFLSNTYLFQEHPDLDYVIGIIPIRGKFEEIATGSAKYRQIMKGLFNKLADVQLIELLIPENVDE